MKKILFVTAECAPFIRSGGLGDVAGALPQALSAIGDETRVILPLYEDIPEAYRKDMEFVGSVTVQLCWRNQYAGLFRYATNGATVYFIDNEYYFKRKGLYGHFDDGERFAFFSKAVLQVLPLTKFKPDIIHVNDWQSALLPVMLDSCYRKEELYKKIKTVLSIHNIEFQGEMSPYVIGDIFGLPRDAYRIVEHKGNANMLKAGIESANAVVAVSKTYAEEIKSPYFAYGLEGILNARAAKLHGIVNGIDTEVYNPATDKALFAKYTENTVAKKSACKSGLQELLGLSLGDFPLIGMVTRLTSQKGIDLVLAVAEQILCLGTQLVILGTGEWKYENGLTELAKRYPGKMAVKIGFSGDLASKIYSGVDLFLMPSKFEPCGLSQMIAMRYGTIPIVRETGGLKDTVPAYNPVDMTGAGITFKTYNAHDMLDAVNRAVALYNEPAHRKAIIANAMSADYSWTASAKKYAELYEKL